MYLSGVSKIWLAGWMQPVELFHVVCRTRNIGLGQARAGPTTRFLDTEPHWSHLLAAEDDIRARDRYLKSLSLN